MRFGNVVKVVLAVSLGSMAWAMPVSAQEGYPMGPGDSLTVSFLSNSEFDRTVTIGADGSIFLPLLGEMNVQGQTINELRQQIPILMTGSVFRERVNGESLLVSVEPQEVMVEVAEYRPIFVDGSVNRPGQQQFSVGMTARQAIAAAEGLKNEGQSALNSAEVRNHPQVLMAELVGVLAEIAVYESILAGSEVIDISELEALDARPDLIQGDIALARSQISTSADILNEELSFLDRSVEDAEARVIAALRREETMAEIAATEEAEVTRVENLVARRIVSSELLTQSRRLYLQAIERLGSVQADRLQAEAVRRELVLERNQSARERALETQARLQQLSQEASQLRVRIDLTSAAPVTLDQDDTTTGAPQIVVFRQVGGQAQEIAARPETQLFPGDVVNVSISN